MTQLIASEFVDDSREFFAPVSSDLIDELLGQYQQHRVHIDHIAGIATGDMGNAIHYFMEGNKDRSSFMPSVERLFAPAGAVAALNSAYWSKTLGVTDVYDCMPQARRDEWNRSISERTTPEFTEDAVRPTINGLLADRSKFFAERVDGLFRALSGEHVTNRPEGFSKRMIIANVSDQFGYSNTGRVGVINDLRAVIAKFMGRDEPKYNATGPVVATARRSIGEWISIDGGALRLRCYKIGTAHLEVHPDMSWRLNQVLAGLYPRAIPAQFRSKPPKKAKEYAMIGRPLPFAVINVIVELRRERGTNRFAMPYGASTGPVREEAIRMLASIGGVLTKHGDIDFDFDPRAALDEIIASGCIPDRVSHQFYPTPRTVALAAIELAQIGPDDTCLEPSAGQGGLAELMPKARTRCVEISKLHCDILEAKGLDVSRADFIQWAGATGDRFDRIVMNPPFSEGRWQAHVAAAAALVRPGGILVAILPASAKGKDVLPGWAMEWSRPYDGEFAGTSVSVVILKGLKP